MDSLLTPTQNDPFAQAISLIASLKESLAQADVAIASLQQSQAKQALLFMRLLEIALKVPESDRLESCLLKQEREAKGWSSKEKQARATMDLDKPGFYKAYAHKWPAHFKRQKSYDNHLSDLVIQYGINVKYL